MFHVPRYSIFLFVGLSILTAYVIHKGTAGTMEGHKSLASENNVELALTAEALIASANQKVEVITTAAMTEKEKCQCTKAISEGHSVANFDYEDPAQCSPGRKIYDNAFKKFSPIFRGERAKSSTEFPRACLLFVMSNSMGNGKTSRSELVSCTGQFTQPVRGGAKPCVTTTYVNTIYNYFGDVTDCMGIPQRFFLPKIFNESGFHMNAYGPGGDAGIGQLTSPAIEEANKVFDSVKNQALESNKESCQRLAPQLKNLSSASHKSPRCAFIATNDNPLRNLIYMGIVYQQNLQFIEYFMKQHKIVESLTQAGLPPSKYDRDQLIQILMTLGYNSGAGTAVTYLSSYLKKMIQEKRKVTLADFDFRIGIGPDKKDELAGDSKKKNKEKADPRALRASRKVATNFPGYLALYQKIGTPGYVTRVRSYADELNKVFLEGVCVPNSYLAL